MSILMCHAVPEQREVSLAWVARENVAEGIGYFNDSLYVLGLTFCEPKLRSLLIHMNIQRNQQRVRGCVLPEAEVPTPAAASTEES